MIELLRRANLAEAAHELYNSLEAPALEKFPLLSLFQDFFRENGATATLMSGSGSTTFAIASSPIAATELVEKLKSKFGATHWTAAVAI